MKFLVAVLLTALFAFISGLWLDWWSIALVGMIIAIVVRQSPGRSFSAGFLGVFLLWGLLAAWIDYKNDSILSAKIAQLLPLGGEPILLILVTAFIGGLVGGFGGLTGSYLRNRRK